MFNSNMNCFHIKEIIYVEKWDASKDEVKIRTQNHRDPKSGSQCFYFSPDSQFLHVTENFINLIKKKLK